MSINLIDDEDDTMPQPVATIVSPVNAAALAPPAKTVSLVGQKRTRPDQDIEDEEADNALLMGGGDQDDDSVPRAAPASGNSATFRTKGGDGFAKMTMLAFGNGKKKQSGAGSSLPPPVTVKVIKNSHTDAGEKDRKMPRLEGPQHAAPKPVVQLTSSSDVAPPPPPPPRPAPVVAAPVQTAVPAPAPAPAAAPEVTGVADTETPKATTVGLVRPSKTAPPPPPPPLKKSNSTNSAGGGGAKKGAKKNEVPSNQPKLDFFAKFAWKKKEPVVGDAAPATSGDASSSTSTS